MSQLACQQEQAVQRYWNPRRLQHYNKLTVPEGAHHQQSIPGAKKETVCTRATLCNPAGTTIVHARLDLTVPCWQLTCEQKHGRHLKSVPHGGRAAPVQPVRPHACDLHGSRGAAFRPCSKVKWHAVRAPLNERANAACLSLAGVLWAAFREFGQHRHSCKLQG